MASNYPQQNPRPKRSLYLLIGIVSLAVIAVCITVVAVITFRGHKPTQTPVTVREDAYLNGLRADVQQLDSDMEAYLMGVPEYEAGLIALENGKLKLSEGQKALDQGYKGYDSGAKPETPSNADYAKALETYNAGVKRIEENTEKYNQGKAKLAQLEPLMPYVTAYTNYRNGVVNSLPGPNGTSFTDAQAWYAQVVLPLAASSGLSLPASVQDFPASVQQHVAEGKADLKEYEEGLAMMEEAKPVLEASRAQSDAGHTEYNNGQAALSEGAAKLAEGEAALAEGAQELSDGEREPTDDAEFLASFEAREDALVEGILKLIETPGVAELLAQDAYFGSAYDSDYPETMLWQKDENGNFIIIDDHKLIDLDACAKVIDAAQEYVNGYEGEPSPWES